MKKIVILGIVVGIISLPFNFSTAQVVSAKELAAAEKAELNNTEWTIVVTPMPEGGRAETDVVSFVDGKVVSKNLQSAGFAETGFTVRVKEDGTVIWETMQIDKKGSFAFWRGDIKERVMRGVLSKRDNKGRIFDFTFVSN